jgi:hypothetical protein
MTGCAQVSESQRISPTATPSSRTKKCLFQTVSLTTPEAPTCPLLKQPLRGRLSPPVPTQKAGRGQPFLRVLGSTLLVL